MSRLWFSSALLSTGWADAVRISISEERIEQVEIGVLPEPEDERHGPAIPGLPNLHSHTFQRAMAGLAERRSGEGDNFWSWRETMYQFLDRLTPDDVEAIATQAFVEMLESGFTHVGEFHYLHNDVSGHPYADIAEMAGRIVSAASTTGIGLTLLPVFYAHANFGGLPPGPGQRRFVTDLDSYARLLDASRRVAGNYPGTVIGIAPHSLRAVTPDELDRLLPLAGDGLIHMHIAEQTREVTDCLAWSGKRPVEWLVENVPVNDRWCLVHATHTTATELLEISSAGATVALCSITEANLGDGVFDARAFLAAGGSFGIGTDSNVLINAAEELRMLEYSQRLAVRERNVLAVGEYISTGRSLFERALLGGRALGLASNGLEKGCIANIVTLDIEQRALVRRHGDTLLDSWIFAARESAIDYVWCRGKKVVADGQHVERVAISKRFGTVSAERREH